MMFRLAILASLVAMMPLAAGAFTLELPAGSVQTARALDPFGSTTVPTGVFTAGAVPTISAEGRILAESWSFTSGSISTMRIMGVLRDQLTGAGFDIILIVKPSAAAGLISATRLNCFQSPKCMSIWATSDTCRHVGSMNKVALNS